MNPNYNIIIFSLLINFLSTNLYSNWWPEKCNTVDTFIIKSDTLLTKFICQKNGRKEILRKKNGRYHGIYQAWLSNGKMIEEFTYFENKIDGEVKGWDSLGLLISNRFFIKGMPVGFHKDFFSFSKPKEFTHYNNEGKKHGLCESWREDGTRKDSIVYNNGEIIEERVYFDNGQPRIWANYSGVTKNVIEHFPDSSKLDKNFNPVINAVYFAPKSGKVIATVKNGSGRAIYYSEDGNSRFFCEYKNGEPISQRELKPGEMP